MKQCIARLLAATALGVSLNASADVSVLYTATDIADLGSEDLWRYSYGISGLGVSESVRISFDVAVHRPLSLDAGVDPWFTEVDPGDVPPGADGHFLATYIGGVPFAVFDLTVVRLAPGPVGPQSFEHLDEAFGGLGIGTTTPVPEPGTWALLGLGATLIARRLIRRE